MHVCAWVAAFIPRLNWIASFLHKIVFLFTHPQTIKQANSACFMLLQVQTSRIESERTNERYWNDDVQRCVTPCCAIVRKHFPWNAMIIYGMKKKQRRSASLREKKRKIYKISSTCSMACSCNNKTYCPLTLCSPRWMWLVYFCCVNPNVVKFISFYLSSIEYVYLSQRMCVCLTCIQFSRVVRFLHLPSTTYRYISLFRSGLMQICCLI